MQRFRVKDLMISLPAESGGGGVGQGGGFPCELLSVCADITFLCVENTQGCAFTEACDCSVQTCGQTCNQTVPCTPCTQQTCGCTCTQTCGCTCTHCTAGSMCTVRSVCTVRTVGCGLSQIIEGPVGREQAALTAEHLGALKAQLRSALARVEAAEQRVGETLKPQTLDEVSQLETKLKEALEELQKRRAELEQQPPSQ